MESENRPDKISAEPENRPDGSPAESENSPEAPRNIPMGKIKAICISEKKGTPKYEVPEAVLKEDWGIEGDAHAGNGHRQISLLPSEKISEFAARGAEVDTGSFGENLIVEGYNLKNLPVGTRLRIGEALLEITQIGKECHKPCRIRQTMGECIMPTEGVFARVLRGGTVKKGDEIIMTAPETDRPFTAAVVTLSDKGAAGEREDKSGPVIVRMLREAGYEVIETLLLSDEQSGLESELIRLSDTRQPDLILTTGGTGFSSRDNAPEATEAVCDRMANGIAEAIRAYSMTITPRAMFSRAVSGIRGNTLIINLPGSPKAVEESLDFLLPNLDHGIEILRGSAHDCARK